MEKIDRPSNPFFTKQLDDASVELHLEPQSESFFIIPYVCVKTPQGPRIKKAQLQGIPSSVAFDQLKQATQVLQQAIIRCREYLSDPVVKVFPRGFGGGLILSRAVTRTPNPFVDQEAAKPSNSNTVAPLRQIPLPSIEEVPQRREYLNNPVAEVLPQGFGGMKRGFLRKKSSKPSSTTKDQNEPKKLSSDLPPLIDEEEAKPSNSNTFASLRQIPLPIIEQILQHLETSAISLERELQSLLELGAESNERRDFRSALARWQEALVLAQSLEDRRLEGQVCCLVGATFGNLEEHRSAIEFHKKSLQIAQEFGDRGLEGNAYLGLGTAYQNLGEYRRAIDCHKKHLSLAKELEDRAGEGTAYGNLGIVCVCLGEYRRAVHFHQKCLEIAKTFEHRGMETLAYGNLGNAYQSLGEYRRAIDYHDTLLTIAGEIEDRAGEQRAYLGLGNAYQSLRKYRRAIDFDERCLAIAKGLEDRAGEGRAYCNLGIAYDSLGEYRHAIDYYLKHLAIATELEDRAGEGISHNNLGLAYRHEGNLSSSEDHFRQAVACFSVLQKNLGADNQSWQISIFEQQAVAYLQLKDVLVAHGKTTDALSVADFGRSRALISFLSRKRLPSAKKPLSVEEIQALAVKHEATFLQYSFDFSDPKILSAWTVSPSGEIAFHQLNVDLVTSTQVSDSLSALAPIGIREACLAGLESLANLTMTRDEAIDSGIRDYDLGQIPCDEPTRESSSSLPVSYQKVLEEAQTPEEQVPALLHLTHVCQIKGQWESLIELASKLESIAKGLDDSKTHQNALIHLAFAYNALGNGDEALPHAEAANVLAVHSGDRGAESGAVRERALAYHLIGQREKAIPLAITAVDLARKANDRQQGGVALRVLGTLVLEGYRAALSRDNSNSNSPPEGSSSEHALRHFLEFCRGALTDAVGSAANADPAEEMRKLTFLAKAWEQADQLGKALPFYNQALKIARELKLTKQIGEISAARKRLVPLLREQTNRLLSEYYQVLIAPLEQHLTPDSRITLITDSALSSLPFAILKDPEGNYLIEKYTLSMVPSMEVLQELDLMEGRAPPTQPALIVGDTQAGLTQALCESYDLAELFGTTSLTGSEATRSEVIRKALEARFLHFSCHGNAAFKTHRNSVFEGALLLAGEETEPSWWSAEEIQKLPLKAELAFLSACKSGRGKLQREGVIGLTRSFLAAGVPTVIATHWSIPDSECTVKIAQAFYSHILRKTRQAQAFEGELGKDEILRQVLLDLIDEDPELRDHPEKWGAFFLLGRP